MLILYGCFHNQTRYTKLADLQNDKMQIDKVNPKEGDNVLEDVVICCIWL